MKRLVLGSLVVSAAVALAAVLLMSPAEAKKTFDEGDLNTTYTWASIHVRLAEEGPDDLAFCSGHGTAAFDGAGEVSIESTERCSDDPSDPTTGSQTHDYEVFADGSFIVYEPDGSGDGTLCLLVDNGKMILCDGTLREPETLAFHVTGVRQ